jgi:hypothetical protein
MRGSWRWFAVAGLTTFAVSAAMLQRQASSDDCRYGHTCPENDKDGRGCCPAPKVDAKQAAAAKKAADAKKAAEAKKAVDAKEADSKHRKADVQPLLSRAHATMSKKALLPGDLPEPAQGLESEATKAMTEGAWGKAYLAAAQLNATVDAVKLDRAFIQAKTARLSNQLKASKLDETTRQQLESVLADAIAKSKDGNFAAANQRLNALAEALH